MKYYQIIKGNVMNSLKNFQCSSSNILKTLNKRRQKQIIMKLVYLNQLRNIYLLNSTITNKNNSCFKTKKKNMMNSNINQKNFKTNTLRTVYRKRFKRDKNQPIIKHVGRKILIINKSQKRFLFMICSLILAMTLTKTISLCLLITLNLILNLILNLPLLIMALNLFPFLINLIILSLFIQKDLLSLIMKHK